MIVCLLKSMSNAYLLVAISQLYCVCCGYINRPKKEIVDVPLPIVQIPQTEEIDDIDDMLDEDVIASYNKSRIDALHNNLRVSSATSGKNASCPVDTISVAARLQQVFYHEMLIVVCDHNIFILLLLH